ncbi:MAG: chemotaxis protein CheX [Desulfuromonas sp.]|jgi:chemotaxis protein CheC|nr:hypothetical protein [Desulfuromonas thiophila]MDD3802078.1 hypothetical protein [Desulfuromonas thiophila]MDY0397388.1 hypothetical protein [Desulfuromonas thiophila]
MTQLSELEQDALKELFNIGMGRAAASLGRMVGGEILLSVPFLDILQPTRAAQIIQKPGCDTVSAIRQSFNGPFNGTALLIFPEVNSLELVRTLVGEDLPLEHLGELEQESLLEVGNIVLNACLGSFANLMRGEILFELPLFIKGSCLSLLRADSAVCDTTQAQPLLFLVVDFRTTEEARLAHRIQGYVLLLLDCTSTRNLRSQLQQLINETLEP